MAEWDPAPGIYKDVPREDYDRLAAANYSALKHFRQSPKHARHKMTARPEATAAMEVGRATHLRVFEPDLYADEFIAAPAIDRRTKAGKTAWADFQAKANGRTVLTADEAAAVAQIETAIQGHPSAQNLQAADGLIELTVVWQDEATGLRCKARVDKYCRVHDQNVIVDLKTTAQIDDHSVQRQAHTLGYFMQAGWYREGLNQVQPADRANVLIWAESRAPFDVRVMMLDNDDVEDGRLEMLGLLRQYHEATKSGNWPGYGDGVLHLPAWACH